MKRALLPEPSAAQRRRKRVTSRVMQGACAGSVLLIAGVLVVIVTYFLVRGGAALNLALLTEVPTARGMPGYPGGLMNGLIGTGILLALASLVGLPIGILTGVYLSEYAANSRLAAPIRFVCDVLAGVPSIVIGIVGYELLVVPVGHFNGLAGALALAFVMIPIVARATEEMLLLVPRAFREASTALGATRAQTIVSVVLPAATGGVLTGVMLALARVASETAPLLFTALGSRLLTFDPTGPLPSLTVQIFNYATGPYPEEHALAWAGMLVLLVLLLSLNVLVRYAVHRMMSVRTRRT